jgi:hypothetical protein
MHRHTDRRHVVEFRGSDPEPNSILILGGPRTSLGTPFDPARPRTWHCAACGLSGPDRDDHPFPSCPKSPHRNGPHGALTFKEPTS